MADGVLERMEKAQGEMVSLLRELGAKNKRLEEDIKRLDEELLLGTVRIQKLESQLDLAAARIQELESQVEHVEKEKDEEVARRLKAEGDLMECRQREELLAEILQKSGLMKKF